MIERIVLPFLGVNCYVLACEDSKKAIVIDPGSGGQVILDRLKNKGIEIELIVLTHGHYDHIGAIEEIKNAFGAKVAIHKEDADMLTDANLNLSCFSGRETALPSADILLEDGQELIVGNKKIIVIHTPGHSPGGVCLFDESENALFSGDTLFCGSVGRTDFPGGSMSKLISSIQNKLMVLDDSVKVFPGHESPSTIGRERKNNPYLNGAIG